MAGWMDGSWLAGWMHQWLVGWIDIRINVRGMDGSIITLMDGSALGWMGESLAEWGCSSLFVPRLE